MVLKGIGFGLVKFRDMEDLEFEIVKIDLVQNSYGKNDIVISMVKVLKNGKYLKFAKLNQELINAMKKKGTVKVKQCS
jgi:hypothetical protein